MLNRLRAMIPREGRLALLAALATLLVGWFKGINLLILLSFALVAIVFLNWWLARRQFRNLRADRLWTAPIFARAPAIWTVETTNESTRCAAGFEIEDAGPHHRQSWFVDQLPGEQSLRVRAGAVFPKRGLYLLEPLRVVCLHPFGLARRQSGFCSHNECLVLPELGKLNMRRFRRWLTLLWRSEARLQCFARPSMIHQDDLHGLRPFRPGDNPRWIHWRTSARRNLKMVREFEEASGLNLMVVFDPTTDGTSDGGRRMEEALSLAATICFDWCRNHEDFLMLVVAGSDPVICRGHTSSDLALEMLQALAVVKGQSSISSEALLKKLAAESVPLTPVLLIGARANKPLCARLESVLGRVVSSVTPDTAHDFYERPNVELGSRLQSSMTTEAAR
jgi:uncharacterized protein (DUF58 family)